MYNPQPKKDKNQLVINSTRDEFKIGHQPHRTGVGAHSSRAMKRTGRRVLAQRAIKEFA